MLVITRHAVERYQERVENVPEIIVRLAGGHLAVIDSGKIVTVLAREMGINAHVGDREGRVR